MGDSLTITNRLMQARELLGKGPYRICQLSEYEDVYRKYLLCCFVIEQTDRILLDQKDEIADVLRVIQNRYLSEQLPGSMTYYQALVELHREDEFELKRFYNLAVKYLTEQSSGPINATGALNEFLLNSSMGGGGIDDVNTR